MKKLALFVTVALLCLGLVGCGKQADSNYIMPLSKLQFGDSVSECAKNLGVSESDLDCILKDAESSYDGITVYQLDDYAYGDLTVTAVLTFNTQMRYGWDTGLSSVRLIAQKEDAQALQDAFEQEMEAQAAYQIESDHYGKGDWQTVPEDTYEAISFVLPGSYSDLAENPTYYQNGSPLSEAAYHEAYVVDGVVQDETVIDNYVVSDQPYVTYTGGYAAYLIHAKECPQDLQDRILGRGVV